MKRRLGWMTSLVAVGCLARCRPVLSLAAGWNLLRRGPRDLSNCLPLLAGDVRAISGEREEVDQSKKAAPGRAALVGIGIGGIGVKDAVIRFSSSNSSVSGKCLNIK